MTFRILACDGGGIRGYLTARLLQSLATDPKIAGWLDRVDLFCGTSTGSAIALALAAGKSPAVLVDLYGKKGPAIFKDRMKPASIEARALVAALEAVPGIKNYIEDVSMLFVCKYDNQALRAALVDIFGDETLASLRKVAIPTFQLKDASGIWAPLVLHNFGGPTSSSNLLAVDAMMRSAAAPTFFPSHQGCVDGGVIANNPCLVGVATAVDASLAGRSIGDLRVLSMGTGESPGFINAEPDIDWGIAKWAKPLSSIMVGGVDTFDSYLSRQILGPAFCRLSPTLKAPVGMDEYEAIPILDETAAAALASPNYSECRDWIAANFS